MMNKSKCKACQRMGCALKIMQNIFKREDRYALNGKHIFKKSISIIKFKVKPLNILKISSLSFKG